VNGEATTPASYSVTKITLQSLNLLAAFKYILKFKYPK